MRDRHLRAVSGGQRRIKALAPQVSGGAGGIATAMLPDPAGCGAARDRRRAVAAAHGGVRLGRSDVGFSLLRRASDPVAWSTRCQLIRRCGRGRLAAGAPSRLADYGSDLAGAAGQDGDGPGAAAHGCPCGGFGGARHCRCGTGRTRLRRTERYLTTTTLLCLAHHRRPSRPRQTLAQLG